MRRVLILCACLLGAALTACGGSASETPWPAEPENAALGPAGESRVGAPSDLDPDSGAPETPSTPPAPTVGDRAPTPY